MIDFAKKQFHLDHKPDGSKLTRREHLRGVEKQTGQKPKALEMPEVEECVKYLLEYYYQIRRTQDPLTWAEILSWSQLYGIELEPFEVDVIVKLDYHYQISLSDGRGSEQASS